MAGAYASQHGAPASPHPFGGLGHGEQGVVLSCHADCLAVIVHTGEVVPTGRGKSRIFFALRKCTPLQCKCIAKSLDSLCLGRAYGARKATILHFHCGAALKKNLEPNDLSVLPEPNVGIDRTRCRYTPNNLSVLGQLSC